MRGFAIAVVVFSLVVLAVCAAAGLWLATGVAATANTLLNNRIIGSGNVITKEYALADFDAVSIGSAFQAEISQGDSFGVSITADDNVLENIVVEKQGSTLRIHLDHAALIGWRSRTLRAKITMPALRELVASGASNVSLVGFKSGSDFKADVSGASSLKGTIDAANATIGASGASRVALQGSAKTGIFKAHSASRLDLSDYAVDTAQVEMSSASNGTVRVSSKLDYDLSGASRLTYSGSPTIGRSAVAGASSLKSLGDASAPTGRPAPVAPNTSVNGEIKVTARNFEFDPSQVTVKKGDTVTFVVTNQDSVQHDFVSRDAGIPYTLLPSGSTQTISWVAQESGTYTITCTFHPRMHMQVIVE